MKENSHYPVKNIELEIKYVQIMCHHFFKTKPGVINCIRLLQTDMKLILEDKIVCDYLLRQLNNFESKLSIEDIQKWKHILTDARIILEGATKAP